uniref:(northern house mosquito) hypothetical protein n=1 Tax=Culex pipiens TaxID=7175 RepID=A0A8D8AWK9_CULPI
MNLGRLSERMFFGPKSLPQGPAQGRKIKPNYCLYVCIIKRPLGCISISGSWSRLSFCGWFNPLKCAGGGGPVACRNNDILGGKQGPGNLSPGTGAHGPP